MFATLYLPNFSLQAALRLREEFCEKPVAIIDDSSNKKLILEATPVARQAGVCPGISGPQALARCPTLTIWTSHPEQEHTAQTILLEVAHSLSPLVEATQNGVCTVDLRGTKTGDWQPWSEKIIVQLARLHLTVQIGVAPNPDLAWLAAQRANPWLVVQNSNAFLRDLPVAVLHPTAELLTLLQSWGIETIGQLTHLPGADLINRLGIAASELCQRARGKILRPLRLVRPVEEFSETLEFECEIETLEPLLFVLRRLLDQLTCRLVAAHRVVNRMTLTLQLENRTTYQRLFTIPSPTIDVEVLFRILDTHLENLQLEQRPVGLRLEMEPVRADHSQLRLFENALHDPNRFGETLARLVALVGTDQVGVACIADTHQPDQFRLREPRFHELQNEPPETKCPIGLPLRRYRPPISAIVQLLQQTPAHVSSVVVDGPIVKKLGPYRLGGAWWDVEKWEREEWDVEIAGKGLYRLVRQAETWTVEGCYDAVLR